LLNEWTIDTFRQPFVRAQFLEWWHGEGPLLRAKRSLQTRGKRTVHGLARDEVWPLELLYRHLQAPIDAVWQLTPPGTTGCDAICRGASGTTYFEIKTTSPLWPRSDGSLADYGLARRAWTRELGKGVSNFGPLQADILGVDFADCDSHWEKRRLLRTLAVGIRKTFSDVKERYSDRQRYEQHDVELLVSIWGCDHCFVSASEFCAVIRLCRRSAPTNLFARIHVVTGEHYAEIQGVRGTP
jgi:hypothetical protein